MQQRSEMKHLAVQFAYHKSHLDRPDCSWTCACAERSLRTGFEPRKSEQSDQQWADHSDRIICRTVFAPTSRTNTARRYKWPRKGRQKNLFHTAEVSTFLTLLDYIWLNQLSNTTNLWWIDVYYLVINYMFRRLWPPSG